MDILSNFVLGLVSVLKITSAPMLYRYPFRISGEGLRADWQKISGYMCIVTDRMRQDDSNEY